MVGVGLVHEIENEKREATETTKRVTYRERRLLAIGIGEVDIEDKSMIMAKA